MVQIDISVVFALAAAVGFGLSTVSIKSGLTRVSVGSERVATIAAAVVSVVVAMTVFWSVSVVRGIPWNDLTWGAVFPFVATGILYPGVFRITYYRGVDRVGPSTAGAIIAASPAVATLLAVPFLGERLTVVGGVGLVCIVAGVALLQLAQRSATGDSTATTDAIERELEDTTVRDLLEPTAALLSFGIGLVLIKYGLASFPHPILATAITQTAALIVFSVIVAGSAAVRSGLAATVTYRGALWFFVLAGAFSAAAWLAQFLALQLGTVVVVTPLVNLFPVVIVIVSYGLARELPRSPRVIVAVVAIVVGASLLQIA